MEYPKQAKWSIHHNDGSDKHEVSYDNTSKYVPDSIEITSGSDNIYVDCEDAAWIAARLLDAARAIQSHKSAESEKPNE